MPIAVCRCERGNVALYTAVVIPLVVSLSILAVDVSSYQALRDKAQKEADRIALQAVRALPDATQAEATVRNSFSALQGLSLAKNGDGKELLEVDDSRVSLTIEGQTRASFDVFLRIAGNEEQVFYVRESSEAQIVPSDTVVIVSDSNRFRPPPLETWGEPLSWPTSKYFSFVAPLKTTQPGPWDSWADYTGWATQSCFNPAYSAVKFAAVSLLDLLSAVETNRVSLIFTPSEFEDAGFFTARELSFSETAGNEPMASWSSYFEPGTYISDEACLYFGDPEVSGDYTYLLPAVNPSFHLQSSLASCGGERLIGTGYGSAYSPAGRLADCFTEKASLRDVLYFHAVRSKAHRAGAQNVFDAINQAIIQLLQSNEAEASDELSRRGNLAARAKRSIVVFTDALPSAESAQFEDVLMRLTQNRIKLYLVPIQFEDVPGYQAAPDLTSALESFSRVKGGIVRVLSAKTRSALAEQVLPQIVGDSREFALRS